LNQNEVNYLFLLPLGAFAANCDDCVGQASKELGKLAGEEETPPTMKNDRAKSKWSFGTK